MFLNYQKPLVKTVSDKSFSFNAFAASVILNFNLNACDGPAGTLGSVAVENDAATICIPPGVFAGGQVITVQCAETGSEVFTASVQSVSCGGTCDSPADGTGDNDDTICDLTVDISPEPPASCTVTVFAISGLGDGCSTIGALTDSIQS
jgi:hypothetical protein